MQFKSPENVSKTDDQPEIEINNFYCFLPGAHYRYLLTEYPNSEKQKIMDAIDKLLLTPEFSNINPQEILTYYRHMQDRGTELSEKLVFEEDSLSEGEKQELESELNEMSTKYKDYNQRLVCLFKKLIEMGFDRNSLAR